VVPCPAPERTEFCDQGRYTPGLGAQKRKRYLGKKIIQIPSVLIVVSKSVPFIPEVPGF
jgi:hypothetical protein